MHNCTIFLVVLLAGSAFGRDFYMGMFKKNDLLVATDTLYKEKKPFRQQVAKYGRLFKCRISYFRIVDRLNVGAGPRVQIIRGGLRHKFIVAKITSGYNLPIAINVYVGCPNRITSRLTTPTAPATPTITTHKTTKNTTNNASKNTTKNTTRNSTKNTTGNTTKDTTTTTTKDTTTTTTKKKF